MVRCAAAALGLPPAYLHPGQIVERPKRLAKAVSRAQVVFIYRRDIPKVQEVAQSCGRPDLVVLSAPRLYFPGFHPDATMATKRAAKDTLPMSNLHSAIVLSAFRTGLSVGQTLTLFRDEVYQRLGYYDSYPLAIENFSVECRQAGLDVMPLMEAWTAPFFYVPLHPTIAVLRDIALAQLRTAGLYGSQTLPVVDDELSGKIKWPVYPEIGDRLGIAGDYSFDPGGRSTKVSPDKAPMDLEAFVERSFAGYRLVEPEYANFPRLNDPRFSSIEQLVKKAGPKHPSRSNEWLMAEANAASQVICDEELLDDGR